LPFAPSTPSACGPSLRAMLFRLRRLPIPGISGTMNARGQEASDKPGRTARFPRATPVLAGVSDEIRWRREDARS
jgi:hypothetical protein